jgi:signal transduction histidine kinase
MAQRSLGSRLAIGSLLWTLGVIAIVTGVVAGLVRHQPTHIFAFQLHWSAMGFAAAILLVAGLMQFRKGLSPFVELRQRLQAVRSGAASQVEGHYPPEVQPVVTDLNELLAHQATAVSRAQAKAGDLAHGLKTPLAVLAQEADRAAVSGQTELAESIRQQVARMERQVGYHLAQARAAASGATLNARCSVADSAQGLARTLGRLYADRGLTIEVHADVSHVARVQREDLDEMLGNILDNACKWTRGRVVLTSSVSGGHVVIVVDDDGAGIVAGMRDVVLQRGVRADEAAPGSGLGLSIVRDLVELYGGSIALGDSPLGGLRVTLTLERASS